MDANFGGIFTQQVREKLVFILKADRPDITQNEIELILSKAFIGCIDAEIEILRTAQQVDFLPDIYCQYLKIMGHQAGGILFRGGDRLLQTSKQVLQRVLDDIDNSPLLSPNAFIFLSYQDVDFFFFIAEKANDDPPVYYYGEGDTDFLKVSDHLSTGFLDQAFDPLRYPSSRKTPTDKGDLPF